MITDNVFTLELDQFPLKQVQLEQTGRYCSKIVGFKLHFALMGTEVENFGLFQCCAFKKAKALISATCQVS